MTSKKTILFAVESLTVGGAERVIVNLANQFNSETWNIHVACLATAGELAADLSPNVTLHCLNKKPGFDLGLVNKLRRLLKEVKPDIINTHLWTANTWLRAVNLNKIPIFVTEHSRDNWKPAHYKKIDKLLSFCTTRLIAVSQDVAAYYHAEIGISQSLIQVILNGVDVLKYEKGDRQKIREELKIPDDHFLLGMVGRMVTAKNYPRLIEAIALIKKTLPNIKCVIAGEGPERAKIEQAIQDKNLSDSVFILGTRSDVKDILAGLDVFTLSSDREGHPLTALEAQVAGIPIVLTDVGGCKDAIVLGKKNDSLNGGIIVTPSATHLADAIIELLQNERKRKKMSQIALRYAKEQFSLERMIQDYETLFLSALS